VAYTRANTVCNLRFVLNCDFVHSWERKGQSIQFPMAVIQDVLISRRSGTLEIRPRNDSFDIFLPIFICHCRLRVPHILIGRILEVNL